MVNALRRHAGSIPPYSLGRNPGHIQDLGRQVTRIVTKRNSTRRTPDLASDLSGLRRFAPELPLKTDNRASAKSFRVAAQAAEQSGSPDPAELWQDQEFKNTKRIVCP